MFRDSRPPFFLINNLFKKSLPFHRVQFEKIFYIQLDFILIFDGFFIYKEFHFIYTLYIYIIVESVIFPIILTNLITHKCNFSFFKQCQY